MLIRCPECQFERYVDETKIPPKAQVATCPKCKEKFRFREHSIPEEPVPPQVMPEPAPAATAPDNTAQNTGDAGMSRASGLPSDSGLNNETMPTPDAEGAIASGALGDVHGNRQRQNIPDRSSMHAPDNTSASLSETAMPEGKAGGEHDTLPPSRPKPLKVKPVGLSPEEEAAHEKLVKAMREGNTIPSETDQDTGSAEAGNYDEMDITGESADRCEPENADNKAGGPDISLADTSGLAASFEPRTHVSEQMPEQKSDKMSAQMPGQMSAQMSAQMSGQTNGQQNTPIEPNPHTQKSTPTHSELTTTEDIPAGRRHSASPLPPLGDPDQDKGDIWDAIAAMGGSLPEEDAFEPDMPEGVPWENMSRLGFGAALYQTASKILRTPGHFFASMGETGGSSALMFFLVSALIGSHLNLLWSLLAGSFMGEQAAFSQNLVESFSLVHYAVSLAMLLLVQLICFYGMAGVYHLFIRLITGKKHSFSTTMRVIGYSGATSLAAAIPLVGSVGGFLWFFALTIIGTKHAHRLQWKQTVLALLPFYMLGLSIMAFVYRAMTLPLQ